MAKVLITGQAIVVTSELKMKDIKMVEKYRPDALVIKGGEDGKEEIFVVCTGEHGSINKFGVSFAEENRSDDKLATLTMVTDYDGDDIKEFVADKIGSAIAHLCEVEKRIPDVLKEINEERANIMENISIA